MSVVPSALPVSALTPAQWERVRRLARECSVSEQFVVARLFAERDGDAGGPVAPEPLSGGDAPPTVAFPAGSERPGGPARAARSFGAERDRHVRPRPAGTRRPSARLKVTH